MYVCVDIHMYFYIYYVYIYIIYIIYILHIYTHPRKKKKKKKKKTSCRYLMCHAGRLQAEQSHLGLWCRQLLPAFASCQLGAVGALSPERGLLWDHDAGPVSATETDGDGDCAGRACPMLSVAAGYLLSHNIFLGHGVGHTYCRASRFQWMDHKWSQWII